MNTNDIIKFKNKINNSNIILDPLHLEYTLDNYNLTYYDLTYDDATNKKPAVLSFKKTYTDGKTDILAAIMLHNKASYSIILFENSCTEEYKEYIDINSIDQYIFSTNNNEDDVIFQMNATLSKSQVLICEILLLINNLLQRDNNEY